jgi:hypothetical protein
MRAQLAPVSDTVTSHVREELSVCVGYIHTQTATALRSAVAGA